MSRLGIVTGMAFEAAILGRQLKKSDPAAEPPPILIAGADSARAGHAARELIDQGATALMSFGIAGALDPALSPGDLIIATRIIGPEGEAVACHREWNASLTQLVETRCRVVTGDLAGSDGTVATAAAKYELFKATSAVAVDMESLTVALAAREAGIPFCAVRAIADPAQREIPGWVPGAISAKGKTRPMAVLSALFGRSGNIGNLAQLARDSQAAKATLGRVALLGAPRFGF